MKLIKIPNFRNYYEKGAWMGELGVEFISTYSVFYV